MRGGDRGVAYAANDPDDTDANIPGTVEEDEYVPFHADRTDISPGHKYNNHDDAHEDIPRMDVTMIHGLPPSIDDALIQGDLDDVKTKMTGEDVHAKRQSVAAARKQRATVHHKMMGGFQRLLTMNNKEITELFAAIDGADDSTVPIEEFQKLVMRMMVEYEDEDDDCIESHEMASRERQKVISVIKSADLDRDGRLSPVEFKYAMKLIATSLRQDAFTQQDCVSCQQLVAYLENQVMTASSCRELPITLVFLVLFWSLVLNHFQTLGGFKHFKVMEQVFKLPAPVEQDRSGGGLSTGWGGRRDEVFNWLAYEFAPNVFPNGILPAGRIATYNQMLGGVRITRTNDARGNCVDHKLSSLIEWYHPGGAVGGTCRVTQDADDALSHKWFWAQRSLEDVQAEFMQMGADLYVDELTREVEVGLATYNAETGFFGVSRVHFTFEGHGIVQRVFTADAWPVRAYPTGSWLALAVTDAFFIGIVCYFIVNELREIKDALMDRKHAVTRMKQYIKDIWNIIDWVSIIATMTALAIFVDIVKQTDQLCVDLQALPRLGGDRLPYPAVVDLLVAEGTDAESYDEVLDEVYNKFDYIAAQWYLLRTFAGFFAFSIMLRFFKSFRANARLSVVTATLQNASIDGVHFLLVFLTIFMCFVITAHILFGHSHPSFDSLWDSLHTCFLVLMGDFDLWSMTEINYGFAVLWFWLFECLVFLLLFNMLLAVVMDVYFKVKGGQSGAQTIWDQAKQWYREVKYASVRRKRITMRNGEALQHADIRPSDGTLLIILKSEEAGFDPDMLLTAESLFECEELSITEFDAQELIKKAAARVEQEPGESLSITDAVRLIGRVDQGVTEIHQKQRESIMRLRTYEEAWEKAPWGGGNDEEEMEDDDDGDLSHHLDSMERKLREVLSRLNAARTPANTTSDTKDWRVLSSTRVESLLKGNQYSDA